jgi:hypothetical protein
MYEYLSIAVRTKNNKMYLITLKPLSKLLMMIFRSPIYNMHQTFPKIAEHIQDALSHLMVFNTFYCQRLYM